MRTRKSPATVSGFLFSGVADMLGFHANHQGRDMNRNHAAARALLQAVEKHADSNGIEHYDLIALCREAGFPQEDWQYAYRLLVGSGYLLTESGTVQLTWAGHDLLSELQAIGA